MNTKTKSSYRDGAIITTKRQGGRYIATIRYTQSGDRETVKPRLQNFWAQKLTWQSKIIIRR